MPRPRFKNGTFDLRPLAVAIAAAVTISMVNALESDYLPGVHLVPMVGGMTALSLGSTGEDLIRAINRLRQKEEQAPPAPAEDDAPSKGLGTILVAEDEDGVRRIVRTVLQAHGYTVIEASSGNEAVLTATQHRGPIDLLLTDVVMPDLGGRALADRVRAQRPQIRVLYMSGYADDALTQRGVSQGDPFLQKPFTPLALTRKIQDVLRG